MYHRDVPQIGGIAALARKRVAVFGAGLEGRCFAKLIAPECAELVVVDDGLRVAPQGAAPLDGLEVLRPSVLEERGFDFVVHSPGISRHDERLAAAARLGAVVTTPTALFLEDFSDRRVIGVTGSKGKTTTSMLTAAVLESSGLRVALAGNIGRPVTELYGDDDHDAFVVELSSFQTAEVTCSPTVGVLTLLSPDHLDWHRGLENYYGDKLRLFTRREAVPVAVNGCCEEAVSRTAGLCGRVLYGAGGPVRLLEGRVVVEGLGPLDLDGFRLLGEHNLLNACGAVTAAVLLCGEPPDRAALELALCSVSAPRSRLEPVGTAGGVVYVDDALASNPEGTIAALRVFSGRKMALIVGGHDRGVDFGPLAGAIAACEPPPTVLFVGEAGAAIAEALGRLTPPPPVIAAGGLEEAVALASRVAGAEVVLFSPAAPTPQAEGSYLDRGRRFREALAAVGGPFVAGA